MCWCWPDEIHCDFISKGEKYIPFSTLENKDLVNNSITYKSVSKSFSLAGMKCAWFFTTNPEVYKADGLQQPCRPQHPRHDRGGIGLCRRRRLAQ